MLLLAKEKHVIVFLHITDKKCHPLVFLCLNVCQVETCVFSSVVKKMNLITMRHLMLYDDTFRDISDHKKAFSIAFPEQKQKVKYKREQHELMKAAVSSSSVKSASHLQLLWVNNTLALLVGILSPITLNTLSPQVEISQISICT